jgi:predicted kinase
MKKRKKIVLMMGYPRSGKTTYAQKFLKSNPEYIYLCPDDMRLVIHGQRWYSPAEDLVWATIKFMARYFLNQGKNILVDGTFLTFSLRLPWISLAKEFDCDMEFMHISTSPEICMKRAKKLGQNDLVPVIARMMTNYENPGIELNKRVKYKLIGKESESI